MSKHYFRINLTDAHERKGLTPYAISKRLNLNQNTVRKYATEIVISEVLPAHVIQLAEFYGVDWRDSAVIAAIEEDDIPDEKKQEALIAEPV